MRGKRIYLDYAAATPLDGRVRAAMEPYYAAEFGNPGSLHYFGQRASAAVFAARRAVAETIGADYREIVFTGSATEANNLALRGAVRGCKTLCPKSYTPNPRVIVSAIEHESVLETARDLERDGVEVKTLPVSRDGIVRIGELPRLLNDRTVLVSVMYANNEVGTIQPIAKIAALIRNFREQSAKRKAQSVQGSDSRFALSAWPFFHTDAVQAFQYLDCNAERLGVDLVTLSAHKIYGPKGVGALFVRQQSAKSKGQSGHERFAIGDLPLVPIITGGGQESGFRSGTENVPGIVGLGRAVMLAVAARARETKRLRKLREYAFGRLKASARSIILNGSATARLPNNLNVYVPGVSAEELIMWLDLAGFAVSAGPACAARSARPSHVLAAMGFSGSRQSRSIRITFGRPTVKGDIDSFVKTFIKLIIRR